MPARVTGWVPAPCRGGRWGGGFGVGGSLPGVRLIVTVAVVVCGPPLPVLPWSLVPICRAAAPAPLRFAAGVKTRPLSPAFSAARVPVAVTRAGPLPLTVRLAGPAVPPAPGAARVTRR